MQYLARARAQRLAWLLMETDLPIGVAMAEVGWRSRGHAARQFAELMGVSPSEFRSQLRARAGRLPATWEALAAKGGRPDPSPDSQRRPGE